MTALEDLISALEDHATEVKKWAEARSAGRDWEASDVAAVLLLNTGSDLLDRAKEILQEELPRAARPARHTSGPATEHAAYELALPKAGTLRAAVLSAMYVYSSGLTDRELSEKTGKYLYSIAPRRTELVTTGWLLDTGQTRPTTADGKSLAVVWALTEKGRSAYEKHLLEP